MRRLVLMLILFILVLPSFAQENTLTPYEVALARIEEAQVSGATELDLSVLGLTELPAEIGRLYNLQILSLELNRLRELPIEIGELINLQDLNLAQNELIALPTTIGNLGKLRLLNLENNYLMSLPPEIGQLTNLESLFLFSNVTLTDIPPEIGKLENLCHLDLSHNSHLTYLPSEIGQLHHLTEGSECYSSSGRLKLENTPLISPPPEVVAQGTPAILDYLRNEAWWHLQRLIAGGATSVGIVVAIVLGLRWKNRRGKTKAKRG
jgi:internalin A